MPHPTFDGFPAEPGSKEAEIASVEGAETLQKSLEEEGPRDDYWQADDETPEEAEANKKKQQEIFLKRRKAEGDSRDDAEMLADLANMLKNWGDTELWKKTSPSFASLLEQGSKADDPDPVHNAKVRWLNGLDLNEE